MACALAAPKQACCTLGSQPCARLERVAQTPLGAEGLAGGHLLWGTPGPLLGPSQNLIKGSLAAHCEWPFLVVALLKAWGLSGGGQLLPGASVPAQSPPGLN